MAKKNVAVLEFGSGHLSVMIGERGLNNSFEVLGFSEKQYAGFMNGEFLEPENLLVDVQSVIASAEEEANCKITHLYIGVPTEFCAVVTKNAEIEFNKRRKVTNDDIEMLFDEADDFGANTTHKVINRCPIYFVLDDGRKIIEPKGKHTKTLSATLSFALCEKRFITTMQQIVMPLHFEVVDYYCETLSEGLFLIEPETRDNMAILVDCGYLTTSVALVMGDGLLGLRSFSLGGGHIMADLCEAFKLTPKQAESLKRKVDISYKPEEDDVYEIPTDDEPILLKATEVNQVVENRISQIGRMINKCIDDIEYNVKDYLPILLTGGGICYVKGSRACLSNAINRDVEISCPPVPQMDKPHASAVLSLLDLALKQNKQVSQFFIIKLFKKK